MTPVARKRAACCLTRNLQSYKSWNYTHKRVRYHVKSWFDDMVRIVLFFTVKVLTRTPLPSSPVFPVWWITVYQCASRGHRLTQRWSRLKWSSSLWWQSWSVLCVWSNLIFQPRFYPVNTPSARPACRGRSLPLRPTSCSARTAVTRSQPGR